MPGPQRCQRRTRPRAKGSRGLTLPRTTGSVAARSPQGLQVEELESGDLPLEKAMKKFEDGIKLTRSCQTALKDAEQKVEILLKSTGGEESLEDFDVDEGDD